MSEQIPKTPAEHMLPNPHITAVPNGEERFLSNLDIESLRDELTPRRKDEHGEYVSPVVEPTLKPVTEMGRIVVRLVQEARENTTDARSGLLNPKGLEMYLERYKPAKFALLMGDGRGFSQVNKKYGHEVGNDVIRFMGEEITSRLRTPGKEIKKEKGPERRVSHSKDVAASVQVANDIEGSVSARWGGDEFMMLIDLSGLNERESAEAIESVQSRLDDFGTYEDKSRGIAVPVSMRTAFVVGERNDGKTFSDYQSEVDEKLQEVTEREKAAIDPEKGPDDVLAEELNKLARRIDADGTLESLPDGTVKRKVEFAGKEWEVLDPANEGLDNFLYNVGNILEYSDDDKTQHFISKGLTPQRIRDIFGDDFPQVVNEIQFSAVNRRLVEYYKREGLRQTEGILTKSNDEILEERKPKDTILTTYAYWLLQDEFGEDDEHLLDLLKQ